MTINSNDLLLRVKYGSDSFELYPTQNISIYFN